MRLWVYLPLLLSAALAVLARPIAARSAPAAAARALAAAAVVASAASTGSLVLLFATLLDDLPPPLVAHNEPGHPRLPEPVPDLVAIAAGVALAFGLGRCVADLRRRVSTHRRLRAAGDPGADGVLIADWAAPYALAVPGGAGGHVLVTTGLLRLLTCDERRVVLAHERAHLAHRHHRLVTAAAAAAALNPVLAPARGAVAYLVERWADEEAASEVGDRHLTARSVAKAALATLDRSAGARFQPVLAMHGLDQGDALGRVRAMTAPAETGRRTAVALLALAALSAACIVTDVAAAAGFVTFAAAWLP